MSQLKIGKHKIEISNPDKVLFPESSITKIDLVRYYEKVAEYMIPHIKDRPVTMNRYPNGINNKNFYQKDSGDYFPDWIKKVKIQKKEGGSYQAPVCNNAASLVYLANLASITPHVWLSKIDRLNKPDKLIFDLDPSNKNFDDVKFAATKIREFFEDNFEYTPFLMTTGSSGLHVILPLKPENEFDKVRQTAQKIAEILAENFEDKLTTETRKVKRKGKVYLDTARNSFGQTSVAPYSIRARKGAPAAIPIDWEELRNKAINSQFYTIKNVFRRLSQKDDPWKSFLRSRKSLNPIIKKLEKLN